MERRDVAREIFEIASRLEIEGNRPGRVRAYRRAALGLLYLPSRSVQVSNDGGLPWSDAQVQRKLVELVGPDHEQQRDDLLARYPESYRDLLTLPGVGPKTATRLISELGIRSLAGVARAARAHRLREAYWIGPEREQRLGEAAESMLQRAA